MQRAASAIVRTSDLIASLLRPIQGRCAMGCTVFRCHSLRRKARYRCCGTRDWARNRRIGGFGGVFGVYAGECDVRCRATSSTEAHD